MKRNSISLALAALAACASAPTLADVAVADDQVVNGGVCSGNFCPADGSQAWGSGGLNGHGNFLTRYYYGWLSFIDESTSPGYSTRSWQLRINNAYPVGGGEGDNVDVFELLDLDALTAPFRVFGAAPQNALVVAPNFGVGVNTETPWRALHVFNPYHSSQLNLQYGTSDWEIGAWENYFYVDQESGGDAEFYISGDAGPFALGVDANGNLGVGAPFLGIQKRLHVYGTDAEAQELNDIAVRVENVSPTVANRRMAEFVNNGAPQVVYTDTSTGRSWQLNPLGTNSFVIARIGYGGNTFALRETGRLDIRDGAAPAHFVLLPNGNLTITGTLTQNSDVNAKHDIAPLDGDAVLARLDALPLSEWRYKADESNALHAGPMAQDFHATFGYGDDPTKIAPGDVAAVALAAVKALRADVAAKDAENAALRAQMAQLLERVNRIEARDAVAAR